jgi:hypothetical protein
MANPLAMALNDVDQSASLPQQASELLYVSSSGMVWCWLGCGGCCVAELSWCGMQARASC